jgi:hypothetical protein
MNVPGSIDPGAVFILHLRAARRSVRLEDSQASIVGMGAGAELAWQRRLRLFGIVQHAEIRDVAINLVIELVLVHAKADREGLHRRGRDAFHFFHFEIIGFPDRAEVGRRAGGADRGGKLNRHISAPISRR